MILLHGTTRWRAERILRTGPLQGFSEPGGEKETEFFLYRESGPFLKGTPEEYARRKAKLFPTEGGAVILVLDVPDEIVRLAESDDLPLEHGLVLFEAGAGLEELLEQWSTISSTASIRSLP
jgi:hypothetical protein